MTIVTEPGEYIKAFTYYATRTAAGIKPFHWYKQHVLSGAKEHCFPEHYIDTIVAIHSLEDEDFDRTENELSIYSG